jgi:hypothetical protein
MLRLSVRDDAVCKRRRAGNDDVEFREIPCFDGAGNAREKAMVREAKGKEGWTMLVRTRSLENRFPIRDSS